VPAVPAEPSLGGDFIQRDTPFPTNKRLLVLKIHTRIYIVSV
jgi:hypothetical protein